MEKDLLRKELRKMFQFHKSILILILKTLGVCLRYGLWLLPWIFLAVFAWKPILTGWQVFTQNSPDPGQARQRSVSAMPYGSAPVPEKSISWEAIPNKVDSGVRTYERISKQIRKK